MATTKTSSSSTESKSSSTYTNETSSSSSTQSAQQQAQAWTRMSEAELYDKALSYFPKKYEAAAWHALAVAGIDPKKGDASTLTGNECWHDTGAPYWWVDTSGFYLPVFTGVPYVSCYRDDEGKIKSTREFGLGLVTACEHRFKEGDEVTITISGTAVGTTISTSASDSILLPLVGNTPCLFSGGEAGDPTQNWSVQWQGQALPDYLFDPRAPNNYDADESPITCRLHPGGIPFAIGDVVNVAIEGGTLRYRRDGGQWVDAPIFQDTSLGDGLILSAMTGVAPSFVTGDTWTYQAVATYGSNRALRPRPGEGFYFDGEGCSINLSLSQPAKLLMFALHSLPSGAHISVAGKGWSLTVAARAGAIVVPLPENNDTSIDIDISGAGSGAMIGWLWAGEGWTPTVSASLFQLVRQYGLTRSDGINPSALFRGAGTAARIEWNADAGAALSRADLDSLIALLDASVRSGLEPVCLIPDIDTPDVAALAVLDQDDVHISEVLGFAQSERTLDASVSLGFKATME